MLVGCTNHRHHQLATSLLHPAHNALEFVVPPVSYDVRFHCFHHEAALVVLVDIDVAQAGLFDILDEFQRTTRQLGTIAHLNLNDNR